MHTPRLLSERTAAVIASWLPLDGGQFAVLALVLAAIAIAGFIH